MDHKSLSNWELRIAIYKLRIKGVYYRISAFVKMYFPLIYFFHVFKVERRFKKNLEEEKKNTSWLKRRPWLIDSIKDNVRERTWAEYQEELITREQDAKEEAEEAERICEKTKLKLDQFMQFLLRNVEENQARYYATQISKLADPEDINGTYKRVCEFVDSVIEKHST